MIVNFLSSWPAYRHLPHFKECFFKLSLRTGSLIISLLWLLLFSTFFAFELRSALDERTEEALGIRCLFNKSTCSPDSEGSDAGLFLHGYYQFKVNHSEGFVTSVTRLDDGLYEWGIFSICLIYSCLILFSIVLFWGILSRRVPVILTWLGVTQMLLLLEVCSIVYDFVCLVMSEQYNEQLSLLFLMHLALVTFISYSLLLINSYTLECTNNDMMQA